MTLKNMLLRIFLNEKLDTAFLYHNLVHTQRVVEKANELARTL